MRMALSQAAFLNYSLLQITGYTVHSMHTAHSEDIRYPAIL